MKKVIENINQQTKNEVEELIGEYIISPISTYLNNNLSDTRGELINELSKIIDTFKPIGGRITILDQNIRKIEKNIDDSIETIQNSREETDCVLKNIESIIENNHEKLESRLENEATDAKNMFSDELTTLKKDINETYRKYIKHREKNDAELCARNDELMSLLKRVQTELQMTINSNVELLQRLLDNCNDKICVSHEEMGRVLKEFIYEKSTECIKNIIEKIEFSLSETNNKIEESLDCIISEGNTIHNSFSELNLFTKMKFKTLLILFTIFGVLNLLLIVFILIYSILK